MTYWMKWPGATMLAAIAAGALLMPLAGRADKEKVAAPGGQSLEVAEVSVRDASVDGVMVISEREPWNETPAPTPQSITVESSNKVEGDIAPAAVGPAADGTLSVFVHLNPNTVMTNKALSPGHINVRNFAQQRRAWVQYEYDIIPNVVNVRGLTPAGIDALKRLPGVVKVEEDSIAHTYHNDSMPLIRAYQSQLVGAGFTGVDGAGIRVCVIDTGIDSNSIMYSTRIDAAAGWDFVNNDSNPEDDNGHGSHCAGTVLGGFVNADFACATTGAESIQGVAPAATLIGIKVLAANGSGSFSNVIAGIDRCASTTMPGGQADVISLSLGGGAFSAACDTDTAAIAVNNAFNAGVVVAVAAGNEAAANAVGTPACASGAITVAAIYDDNFPNCDFPTQTSFAFANCTDTNPVVNQRCCFSNRSSLLEVAAPGCLIFSADSTVAAGNGLVGFCGTSQATPHVAGLAALLLDANPSLTPTQVRNHINNGAVDLGAAGFDTNFGWGRIDAINSLNLAAPPSCTTNAQCNDAIACTTDVCNLTTGSCEHTPNNAACSDGLFCNGAEICNVTTGCQDSADPCVAGCDEATDTCIARKVWMSFTAATTVPGVGTVENEDIVEYNTGTATWSLIFDGSDVGLAAFTIDGVARTAAGDILYSVGVAGNITGLVGGPSGAAVDDSDVIRFTPTSLGATTAGTHTFYFDGSDVGLTTDNEDVDAISLTTGGNLVLSTLGAFNVSGVSGEDEDLITFTSTSLGSVTAGSYAMYFDGSDVGLSTNSGEDVDAAGLTPGGTILLSTQGAFAVTGVSGEDEDVIEFTPTTTGTTTAGSYVMLLDLSTIGIATGANVNAIEQVP